MNNFKLTILANDETGRIFFREELNTTNLVELYSKLLIQTARLQEIMSKEALNDDDIPF